MATTPDTSQLPLLTGRKCHARQLVILILYAPTSKVLEEIDVSQDQLGNPKRKV
jgi:hypothetical protein